MRGRGWAALADEQVGDSDHHPVPVKATLIVGETGSLLATVRLAVLTPALVGPKVRATVQLVPAAKVKVGLPHVPPAAIAN